MCRLTTGLDVLEEWSKNATQHEKNVVHQVLFAVTERLVFSAYLVVDDVERPMEFFILTRFDLAIKIRIHDLDEFGIVYIGPGCDAPGLDVDLSALTGQT
jgi:hypothetical protein